MIRANIATLICDGCVPASLLLLYYVRLFAQVNHEALVQFALDRGVPAVIGVFGSIKFKSCLKLHFGLFISDNIYD